MDDPVDAVALHGFTGAWGVVAVGLFANDDYVAEGYGWEEYGIFYGGSGKLLACQLLGIVCMGGEFPRGLLARGYQQ